MTGSLQDVMAAVTSTSPATPESAPGTPVPTQTTIPASSPPGRRPQRGMLLVIAAVVVVAVVVLAMFLTGVLPGLRSNSGGSPGGSPGEALAYSAALPLANSAAAGAPDGPWTLVDGVGFDVNAPVSFGIALFILSGFTIATHYLTTARPEIPPFGGSLSSGLSPWWFFQYNNGSTDARGQSIILAVVVVNGTGIAAATGSSPEYGGVLTPSPGAPILDSPAAMAIAVTGNTSYISAHPGLNVSFGPHYSDIPGQQGWFWVADFSTCAPFGQSFSQGATQYNGTFYFAEVNDSSGSLLNTGSPQQTTCSSLG